MEPPSEPIDKPRRRRKEARPQEIIAAGLAEFAERGFAATRLEDVAARAGVVKGTIYRYFDSKETLFEAALSSGVGPAFESLPDIVADHDGSTFDLLRLLVVRLYETLFLPEVELLARIIISEGHRFPAVAELYHRILIGKGRDILRRIIERGLARGELSPSPLSATPEVLIGPVVMAIVWNTTFDRLDPIEPKRFLEAHLDLLEKALGRNG
ncbi:MULTISPECIES: TetR/AcrR family transcriptional regulator [Methylosinus]|uniref:TetR/AcrR family transcriptional regulator n=1 Tax=Methylosinus TaxID=425 RepID=UPI0002D28CDB|nr:MULTISPECIES: TetR/AcrR family transcriptional regulator [Methylosinus]